MHVLFTLTGVTVNPASMKQALTASAIRLDEANMFEQGMSMRSFYGHMITLLISLWLLYFWGDFITCLLFVSLHPATITKLSWTNLYFLFCHMLTGIWTGACHQHTPKCSHFGLAQSSGNDADEWNYSIYFLHFRCRQDWLEEDIQSITELQATGNTLPSIHRHDRVSVYVAILLATCILHGNASNSKHYHTERYGAQW